MNYSPALYQLQKETGERGPSGAFRLTRLSGKHLKAINYHMHGLKGYEIARELKMTEAWVSTVLNDPLAQEEIRARFVAVDRELDVKAMQRVEDALDAESVSASGIDTRPDHAIRLRAAEMVWKASGRYAPKTDAMAVSAEDIVSRMLAAAKERGGASVTISASMPSGVDPTLTIEGETG